MTETEQLIGRCAPEFYQTRDEEPWRSLSQASRDIKPTRFTRLRIATKSGFRVFGVLRDAARDRIQVLTTIPVPVHHPFEITLEGCQSVAGEAFYCIKRSSVFVVGIVLSSPQRPNCTAGSLATIHDLEAPLASCRGNILDIENTSLLLLCKMAFPPGAWLRLESRGWILLGVVSYVGPAGTVPCYVRVHVEAAFRADSSTGKPIPGTHILRSFPKLQPWTRMDGESPLQGDIL
jgi:hypothetical protein